MGDMALEIAYAERDRIEREMNEMATMPKINGSPRYATLSSQINQVLDEINGSIGDLNSKLEYVRDQSDSEKTDPGMASQPTDPNRCGLDETFDSIYRELNRINRRLNMLFSEIRL